MPRTSGRHGLATREVAAAARPRLVRARRGRSDTPLPRHVGEPLMNWRRKLGLGIAAGVAAAALAGGLAASATAAPTTGALRICSSCASYLSDPSSYQYMILQTYMAASIPALKAANPSLKVLVYKDASLANRWGASDAQYLPTGVGY